MVRSPQEDGHRSKVMRTELRCSMERLSRSRIAFMDSATEQD
jgi:hypothetical protein